MNEEAQTHGRRYLKERRVHAELNLEKGRHYIGIVGPRGVGKTIVLKQLAASLHDAFYLSADTLQEKDLFTTARILAEQFKIKTLLIDEIHFSKHYTGSLKKLFDFTDIRIIFTSSVALSLYGSAHDLSRRVVLKTMYPFCFREFLYFTRDEEIPALTLPDIVKGNWTADHMRYESHFDDFLRGRLYPFTIDEPDYMPLFRNILQKIIHKDIPVKSNLRFEEIGILEKVVSFIGRSRVDGVNYSSLSRNLGITKYKAEQYINLLKQSFIVNTVFPKGTNVLQEPKVLLSPPYRLLYRDWDDALGGLREDFFAEMMAAAGYPMHYLKSKRGAKTPDYLIEREGREIVIEIGGKGKGRSQFKGVDVKEKLVLSHYTKAGSQSKPLSLIGFLKR